MDQESYLRQRIRDLQEQLQKARKAHEQAGQAVAATSAALEECRSALRNHEADRTDSNG